MNTSRDAVIGVIKELQVDCYSIAREKGWYDLPEELVRVCTSESVPLGKFAQKATNCMALMLMVSEVAEAMESDREDDPADEHLSDFTGMEVELADVVIRAFNLAESRGFRLGEALVAKIEMNRTRERKHGDKLF